MGDQMKRILVVSSDFPFPPNHGGRKDVWEKIKAFKELNFKIDLICTVKKMPTDQEIDGAKSLVTNIKFVQRKNKARYLFSFLPIQLKSRKALEKIEIEENYSYIILEGDYVLPILNNKNISRGTKIIYRMHNDEAVYFDQLKNSEKNILKKFYYFSEQIKFKFVYKRITSKLPYIWFISKDEMDKFVSRNSNFNGAFIPPYVPTNSYIAKNIENKNVLFIGSLFMINNQEAIKWYLENIHDKVSKEVKNYKFTIAGNSRGQSLQWLYQIIKKREYKKNINIYDTPTDLESIYLENSVFVNPMLHGAGVKLKTIEAIQKGLAVVSTKVGIEGTGLINKHHVYVAKNKNEFIEQVILLLKNDAEKRRIIESSQNYLKTEFNVLKKIRKYLNEIEKS
jgi:polysaccharide biosynthesis protein PslH